MNTIIAISHDSDDAGDRLSLRLQQAGYHVKTACPAVGNPMPKRPLSDNLEHDAALGTWFHDFFSRWIGPAPAMKEAAE